MGGLTSIGEMKTIRGILDFKHERWRFRFRFDFRLIIIKSVFKNLSVPIFTGSILLKSEIPGGLL
jgi:hypothetical protein